MSKATNLKQKHTHTDHLSMNCAQGHMVKIMHSKRKKEKRTPLTSPSVQCFTSRTEDSKQHDWIFTAQPTAKVQSGPEIFKSLVKVGFTVDVTHHLMFEDDEKEEKKKLNELERQK